MGITRSLRELRNYVTVIVDKEKKGFLENQIRCNGDSTLMHMVKTNRLSQLDTVDEINDYFAEIPQKDLSVYQK